MFEGPMLQIAAAFPKIAFRSLKFQVFAKKMLHVIDIVSSRAYNIQPFRITWSMDKLLYLLVARHAMLGTHARWTCRDIRLKHQLMESGAIIQPYKVGAMLSFLAPWFLPQFLALSMFFIVFQCFSYS